MSPRQDVREERKTQIIGAATKVFSKTGFVDARMEDIALEAGLSKGALYLYFKSKDDLIIGMIEEVLRRELDGMRSLITLNIPARERLSKINKGFAAQMEEVMGFMAIFYDIVSLAIRREDVQTMIKTYFNETMDILVPIIQDGIDKREFKDIDAEGAAIAFGAIIEGTILLTIYDPSRVDITKHLIYGSELLLEGLLTS